MATDNKSEATVSNALTYPYDYLDIARGEIPKTVEEAGLFWSYRKDRPMVGVSREKEYPDGQKMYNEMKSVRKDLVKFTNDKVDKHILLTSTELGLSMPMDRQKPVNISDVKKAISSLEPTESNILLVYKFFF